MKCSKILLIFIGSNSLCCFFVLLMMVFKEQMFYILKANFSFSALCFFVLSRNPLHRPECTDFPLCSFQKLQSSGSTFFPMKILSWNSTICWKSFSFLHWRVLASLWKTSWLYMNWSISQLLSVLLSLKSFFFSNIKLSWLL